MLTSYSLMRAAINRELGAPGVSAQQRMDDALLARRCRNVFFRATAPIIHNSAATVNIDLATQSLTYGIPIILTDILNYDNLNINGSYWHQPNFLSRLFTENTGGLDDFFGSTSLMAVQQMLGHERNDGVTLVGASPPALTDFDSPSNKINFLPYMLRPQQVFNIKWRVPSSNTANDINTALDFRGITVLPEGDMYGQLCGRIKDQVCSYIAKRDVETMFLDVQVPVTDFTAQGQTIDYRSLPQERPLLILGMSTNLNGLQVQMRDLTTQWDFCLPQTAPVLAYSAGLPVTSQGRTLQGVPLYVLASNPELTCRDAYYEFPVPHLLEPNTSILFRLTNGLKPLALANTFQQVVNTIGRFNNGGGVGKITLKCRTV